MGLLDAKYVTKGMLLMNNIMDVSVMVSVHNMAVKMCV